MERKKDKDARSLFTLEPFQLYRQGSGLSSPRSAAGQSGIREVFQTGELGGARDY